MSEESVARRYARALFDIAAERQAFDKFEQDVQLANGAMSESREVERFLLHPNVDAGAKKDAIKAALSGKVEAETLSLIEMLIDRSRLDIFPALAEAYVEMANQARNIVDAVVYTAYPLAEGEMASISGQFGGVIGKTVRMVNKVDAAIIGGLIVRIGDRLYDGSVQGKLFRFKQQLAHS